MNKKELYKKWETDYNVAARAWNAAPGVKLSYPQDRFHIDYCECKRRYGTEEKVCEGVTFTICSDCKHPPKGEFD